MEKKKRSEHKSRKVLLVDLDNIYIINNCINIGVLKDRVKKIKRRFKDRKIYWFGNEKTRDVVRSNKVILGADTIKCFTDVEPNSADHKLISVIAKYLPHSDIGDCIKQRSGRANINFDVLTGDKILIKTINRIFKCSKKIHYWNFNEDNKIRSFKFDMDLKDKDEDELFQLNQSLLTVRLLLEAEKLSKTNKKDLEKIARKLIKNLKKKSWTDKM